jgi:hypothetical protein
MKYVVVVERTNDGFCAYSPDLLGCGAMGDTVEETLESMQKSKYPNLKDLHTISKLASLNLLHLIY